MEFLLEIASEEMPPAHVKAALAQIKQRLEAELSSFDIAVDDLKVYGTSRRLTLVADLAPSQKDKEQVLIGPPRSVAFAPDGSPGPAALGFARSQKSEVGDLQVVQTAKGEYLALKKIQKGKHTGEILVGILPKLLGSIAFPKTMRWAEGECRFSRPIKGILCLFGGSLLRFTFAGVESGDTTTGHKIHCPQRIRIGSFEEYRDRLADTMVIIREEDRKAMILAQIQEIMVPLKARIYPDEGLLEKLILDIEHPHVFMGSFPEDYLSLPLEVLSTALREGQKLFSVVREKKQLPLFLGVADNSQDSKSFIRQGNERVLKARLEDARFFWDHDLRIPLSKRASGLKKVVFQEKLGSYEEKIQRLKKITAYLCDRVDEKEIKKELLQAVEIAKADLLTEMVREFPSLQGKIGGLYARKEGCPAGVWQTVYEHYQPVGLDDNSPASLPGALLSIADKLDSIVGAIGIGVEVSGSSDPFGLRRNAHGVCKVILDKKLNLSFPRLLEKIITVYGEKLAKPKEAVLEYCLDFFAGRLRYMYERMGYRYDFVNAVLGSGVDDIEATFARLKALENLKASPDFEPLILLARRVNNILRDQPAFKINPELFEEKQERELYSTFSIIERNVAALVGKGDFLKAQSMVFRMQACLNAFFDRVLIMAEDKKIRQNRLGLLQAIQKLFSRMADYSQVVIEGDKS